MATKLSAIARTNLKRSCNGLLKKNTQVQTMPKRSIVYTETGGVLPEPPRTRIGFVGVGIIVPTFIFMGAMIGKEAAAFMVENDIFIPDDDDD